MLEEKENWMAVQKKTFKSAFNFAKKPILIALFVTPIRFSLELAKLSENIIFIVGLLWLTLAFAIYLGVKIYREKHAFLLLFLSLVIFSPISRIPVAIFWWIDTKWNMGTHYGLYFDSFAHALLNQVGYGTLIQIVAGVLLGSITIVVMRNRKVSTLKSNALEHE